MEPVIKKPSDVRIAKVEELKDFLAANNVPFETDSNKPRLQELAMAVFQPTATGSNGAGDLPTAPSEPDVSDTEVPTPPTPPAAKVKDKADKMEETEKQRDARLASVPGSRRDLPLAELLDELARKGFENKQQLADLLEATTREKLALQIARNEFTKREQAIESAEIKLAQRIAASEADFKKIHKDKDEAEQMLERAVRLNKETSDLYKKASKNIPTA